MNKSAKTNWTAITGVAMVLVLAFVVVVLTGVIKIPQSGLTGQVTGQPSGTPYISTGATTLNFDVKDKLASGTSVTGTPYLSLSGGTFNSGITSASPNQVYDVLFVNGTTYHNAYITGHTIPQSPTDTIKLTPYKSAVVTMQTFNSAGVLTDGVAVNQTVSTGSSPTMKLEFTGSALSSTQDMICVFEESNKTAEGILTLSGNGAKLTNSIPRSYSAGAGSTLTVYELPPLVGTNPVDYSMNVQSATPLVSMAGENVKATCYTKEYATDSLTGLVTYAIEDSQNLGFRSLGTYTTTVYFS